MGEPSGEGGAPGDIAGADDVDLMHLVALAVRPFTAHADERPVRTPVPADVAAAGRMAWTWRRVDRELVDLLTTSPEERRRR